MKTKIPFQQRKHSLKEWMHEWIQWLKLFDQSRCWLQTILSLAVLPVVSDHPAKGINPYHPMPNNLSGADEYNDSNYLINHCWLQTILSLAVLPVVSDHPTKGINPFHPMPNNLPGTDEHWSPPTPYKLSEEETCWKLDVVIKTLMLLYFHHIHLCAIFKCLNEHVGFSAVLLLLQLWHLHVNNDATASEMCLVKSLLTGDGNSRPDTAVKFWPKSWSVVILWCGIFCLRNIYSFHSDHKTDKKRWFTIACWEIFFSERWQSTLFLIFFFF